MNIANRIALQTQTSVPSTLAVLALLSEGATIPFIARYRKDKTGNLDEVHIQQIQEIHKDLLAFDERKAFILKTIDEQGKLTQELSDKIEAATQLYQLEDIYLPYKPKRRTKAQIARENGLEPLAKLLMEQGSADPEAAAEAYINDQVRDVPAALQGAREIISEQINEDAVYREGLRKIFEKEAQISSAVVAGNEEKGAKFKDYFEFSESISTIPSHRLLAVMRGFMEGILRMTIAPEEERTLTYLEEHIITNTDSTALPHIRKAIKDAYKRLLQPSLETEFRNLLKVRADEEAIQVFADNLKQLLLSAPLGEKIVLSIDPGYRTGCKVVVLDEKGDLLANDIIYVHEQNFRLEEAAAKIRKLVQSFRVQAFAIGDGTAGRETEQFVKSLNLNLPVYLVNEDGASIYSASEIAREEFPDYDITVRGSVSIGRRLKDPLAELVKIDPKSIGVGQYQHDVNQFRLKEKLDQTVESCVNAVGVNLNTAGKHLLSYISGIGPSLAENIVSYRKDNGQFKNRKELLKVPRLGVKVYEQCAGFLKVVNGEDPLDNSSVHPESYHVVYKMADRAGISVGQLIGNQTVLEGLNPREFIYEDTGAHTVNDIIRELKKPGLDPREHIQQFEFASIYKIDDVTAGSVLPGIVTNITKFGAFVDIGVKQDGLVHVSEIANRYISDPAEALKLNQKVLVKVLEVDIDRSRISLSIKQALAEEGQKSSPKPKSKHPESKKQNKPEKISTQNWFSSLESLKSKLK
ncbi:MAG: RNA-binding transcriptional accessory protein [Taibaiella sp.]|nr:RNA-binding transcriptional accessory protein [Taibaiella sp.]